MNTSQHDKMKAFWLQLKNEVRVKIVKAVREWEVADNTKRTAHHEQTTAEDKIRMMFARDDPSLQHMWARAMSSHAWLNSDRPLLDAAHSDVGTQERAAATSAWQAIATKYNDENFRPTNVLVAYTTDSEGRQTKQARDANGHAPMRPDLRENDLVDQQCVDDLYDLDPSNPNRPRNRDAVTTRNGVRRYGGKFLLRSNGFLPDSIPAERTKTTNIRRRASWSGICTSQATSPPSTPFTCSRTSHWGA
jgi:hypothetical protein